MTESASIATPRHRVDIDKVLTLTAFVCLLAALIVIARTPAATGYELTIYDAYPSYLWLFIILSSASGIGILLRQTFARQRSGWWLAGLIIVVVTNSIFLALPFFRGYAFFPGGDAMSHIGRMKDMLATGYIQPDNFYPVVHILGVSLLDITGLDEAATANLLFVSWYIVFLLSVYILATVLSKERGQALLITALAAPLIFSSLHTLIHPSMLSLFMVPLLLYFYHRKQSVHHSKPATALALILLAIVMTFIHPVTAVFAISLLLTLNLAGFLYRRVASGRQLAAEARTAMMRDYNSPLIMFAIFFLWYFSYAAIQRSIKAVNDFLLYGDRTPLVEGQLETLAMAELTMFQTVELFIYRYGTIFFYGLVASAATLIALKRSLHKRSPLEPANYAYALLFMVAVGASAFSLFGFTGEYSPVRISRFFLIITPLVSGLVLYQVITRQPLNRSRLKPGRKALIGVIATLILAACVLSISTVYPSPRVMETNAQRSQMEIAGTLWFSSNRDADIAVAGSALVLLRFDHFNFGRETSPLQRAPRHLDPIPSHFGYDENDSIAETFGFQTIYLLTSERARTRMMLVPENARHMTGEYTEDDFARLRADPAAAQIYANGEFDIWWLYGEEPPRQASSHNTSNL